MSKERDEFMIVLAREYPDLSSHTLRQVTKKIITMANLHGKYCCWSCNGRRDIQGRDIFPEYTDAEYDKDIEHIEKRIKTVMAGYAINTMFSHDPRGCTVKLLLPSGRSNSMGGEGWCLPGMAY